MVIASIIGVWLFAVQHRFEETLWQRDADWTFGAASLQGSSYLKLPRILQWFTGNIGFHHIHHLNPRIPNYRLPACHAAIQQLHAVPDPLGCPARAVLRAVGRDAAADGRLPWTPKRGACAAGERRTVAR
ncbi:fatty acid desaturase [Inquilinus ginsengisoli]